MAQAFGNPLGPIYPLGLITVAAAGTPVLLTTNVVGTTAFGTVASPSLICANQIIICNPSGSLSDVQLCYVGQAAASGSGTSVILNIPMGTTLKLEAPNLSNPFQINRLRLDATTSGAAAYITLVIV